MTAPADFLRAICDDPLSDSPRLVYADWLEEHGQSDAAEFIRVGCEAAASECRRCKAEHEGREIQSACKCGGRTRRLLRRELKL